MESVRQFEGYTEEQISSAKRLIDVLTSVPEEKQLLFTVVTTAYGTEGGYNTTDKVYLLSIGEVTNAEYGFCSDYSTYSVSRHLQASSYANRKFGFCFDFSCKKRD